MPIALCRPDTSSFAGMSAIVASPGVALGVEPGMRNLITVLDFLSEKAGSAWTLEGSKCFIAFILLAAAGSARIVVSLDEGSSCRRVGSWQWSGLSCDISTTFGSGM